MFFAPPNSWTGEPRDKEETPELNPEEKKALANQEPPPGPATWYTATDPSNGKALWRGPCYLCGKDCSTYLLVYGGYTGQYTLVMHQHCHEVWGQ